MKNQVPLVDLRKNYQSLKTKIDAAIQRVIDKNDFILGNEVKKFESNFASFLNVKYCAGVSSGTAAIELALKALNISHGDEVITTAHTWISTVEAISNVGAIPVFADIDNKTFTIDPKEIRKKITKKTKALLPVHLYGQPARMKEIIKIAKEFKLKIIEDAAQAHGAKIFDKYCGTYGDIGCFSFYPGKNLGAFGDAGCVVSNNKLLINKIKKLRNHGSGKTKNNCDILGSNERLDGIQASILNVKLSYLEKWVSQRNKIAEIYDYHLNGLVKTPVKLDNIYHAYHLYVIQTDNRRKVLHTLKRNSIDARVHYPLPVHKQNIYKEQYKKIKLSMTEDTCKKIISLPIFPEMTKKQVLRVCEVIKKVLK